MENSKVLSGQEFRERRGQGDCRPSRLIALNRAVELELCLVGNRDALKCFGWGMA